MPLGGGTSIFIFIAWPSLSLLSSSIGKELRFLLFDRLLHVEVGLAVRKERNIDFAVANSLVSAECLELLAVIAKRDVQEINRGMGSYIFILIANSFYS